MVATTTVIHRWNLFIYRLYIEPVWLNVGLQTRLRGLSENWKKPSRLQNNPERQKKIATSSFPSFPKFPNVPVSLALKMEKHLPNISDSMVRLIWVQLNIKPFLLRPQVYLFFVHT